MVTTSEATKGEGGTKKSLVLRTVPFGVLTEKRPDATPVGTVVAREVALTDVKTVRAMLRPRRFSAAVVSNSSHSPSPPCRPCRSWGKIPRSSAPATRRRRTARCSSPIRSGW